MLTSSLHHVGDREMTLKWTRLGGSGEGRGGSQDKKLGYDGSGLSIKVIGTTEDLTSEPRLAAVRL